MVLIKKPKLITTWKKKDGTRIRICDMSTDHLNNAIRLWQAKEWKRLQKDISYYECVDASDYVPYCGVLDPHTSLSDNRKYMALVAEAERRGYEVVSITDDEARKIIWGRKGELS